MFFVANLLEKYSKMFALSKLEMFLVGIFSLIFAGFFFLPTAPHRLIMYVGMLGMVFYLYRERIMDVLKKAPFLLHLVLAFIVLYGLSAFWSVGVDFDRVLSKAKLLFFIPLCFLSFFLLITKLPKVWQIFCAFFLCSAFLTGVLLLLLNFNVYFVEHSFGARLEGFGRAGNSVQCALMYGLSGFLFAFPSPKSIAFFKKPYVRIVGFLLCFLIVLLTGSRGPLLALLGCLMAVMLVRTNIKRALLIFTTGLIILISYLFSPLDIGGIKSRGDSARLTVWKEVILEIKQKPVFGHGVAQENDRSVFYAPYDKYVPITHAHSIYLSTLVHIGFFGFSIFVAVLFFAGCYCIRIVRHEGENSVLGFYLFGLILGIFDFGGYFTNLGTTWIVFWFPLAFICAYLAGKGEGGFKV